MTEPNSILQRQIEARLPPGMALPAALKLLCAWIERHGYYRDSNGARLGYLQDPDDLPHTGTSIVIGPDRHNDFESFPEQARAVLCARLFLFARSGKDGSEVGLWLDADGTQKIVHMGSGSGSDLMCVLAENAIDFLRLLAIGYQEICWDEEWDAPPDPAHPVNMIFRQWVEHEFSAHIPRRGLEIVPQPAHMDDDDSADPFWLFMQTLQDLP